MPCLPLGDHADGPRSFGHNATVCHQGRTHSGTVETAIADLEADTVSETLGFINVHLGGGVAAGVAAGSVAQTGYSLRGSERMSASFLRCSRCQRLRRLPRTAQHRGRDRGLRGLSTRALDDITEIRTRHADFDGDGRTDGGIREEIAGLHAMLGQAIGVYARDVAGTPIGYIASGSFRLFLHRQRRRRHHLGGRRPFFPPTATRHGRRACCRRPTTTRVVAKG